MFNSKKKNRKKCDEIFDIKSHFVQSKLVKKIPLKSHLWSANWTLNITCGGAS